MIKYIRLFLQVAIAVSVYLILSSFISDIWVLVIFLSVTILIVLNGNKGKKSHTYYLDTQCNSEKHLIYVEVKLKNKNESLYILYKTYGELLNGKTEGFANDLNKIDISELNMKERFLLEEIKLKLIYIDKDIDLYSAKLLEITNADYYITLKNELLIIKAPLYLLKEEYTELVDLMFEIIPKQKESYRIIELEYYLCLAYIAQGKEEDAIAVLEFITKRDFKLDFVTKSRVLLEGLKKN